MPSAITSILNGIQSRNAARDASRIQQAGAAQAGQTVQTAVGQVNPQIASAAQLAGEGVTNAAGDASGRVINTAADAGRDVRYAADDAAGNVRGAGTQAAAGVNAATADANKLLDPFASVGGTAVRSLGDMLAPGGALTKTFSGVDFQNDPGYQFRMQEAQKAIERSAAARGGSLGGGVLQALGRQSQGQASSEYGAAFDRFQRQQDSTYSRLSDLSKIGLSASGKSADNLIGAGKYGGDMGFAAEKTAGDLTTRASEYSGNANTRAAEVAGNFGNRAAEYTGNAGIRSSEVQGNNTLHGADFLAQTQLGAADADAQGHLGAARAWSGMLNNIGSTADFALTGGLSSLSNIGKRGGGGGRGGIRNSGGYYIGE